MECGAFLSCPDRKRVTFTLYAVFLTLAQSGGGYVATRSKGCDCGILLTSSSKHPFPLLNNPKNREDLVQIGRERGGFEPIKFEESCQPKYCCPVT